MEKNLVNLPRPYKFQQLDQLKLLSRCWKNSRRLAFLSLITLRKPHICLNLELKLWSNHSGKDVPVEYASPKVNQNPQLRLAAPGFSPCGGAPRRPVGPQRQPWDQDVSAD